MRRTSMFVCVLALPAMLGKLHADEPKASDDQATAATSSVGEATSPAQVADPEVIRLRLMDGALISGKLTVPEIDVETEFGKLTVPIVRIRSMRPGLGSHPKLGRQIHELIEDLGASQFDRREAAQKALIKLGAAARGELDRRQDMGEKERRTRIKAILAELDEREQAFDADLNEPTANDGEMIQQDTVETMQFTIVGRIVPQEFTINSPYGPLHVKLSDIRSADRDVIKSETLRKSLAVEGTHLAPAGMKPARLNLQRGDRVSISASGTITMTPWGSRAFSTPDGASNYGWFVQNEIPGGALVAKIGDSGPIFKVGSKHAFVADRSGDLQLGVAAANNPHPHNQAFPGQYNVNVVVRRK